MNAAVSEPVYVCTGKHCRKQVEAQRLLLGSLGTDAILHLVGCQNVCKGPVVGVEVDGTVEWFKRIDTHKSVGALVKLSRGKRLRKSLAKRRVKKRRGKLRGKLR